MPWHRWILSLLIALSLFLAPAGLSPVWGGAGSPGRAASQADSALYMQTVTFVDLGYPSDETLHGVLVTRDYTVRWPEAWEPQAGNSVTLQFSHSPSLRANSSMAVDWNGVRIASALLTPDNAEQGSLVAAIPTELIQPGFNRLHLEFYMGIQDDFCQDIDNPSVWATVHSSSFFTFAYNLKSFTPDLGLFPLPFIDNSPLVDNRVTFVLPEQPTPAELSALAAISAKFGQLAAFLEWNADVLPESQITQSQKVSGNLIYIGRTDRLEILKTNGLPDLPDEDAGILIERASTRDESSVILIVTGKTDAGVVKAGRALASEPVYARLSGPLGIILDVPPQPEAEITSGQSITLEELGYQDITARGTREQTINYVIPLLIAWQNQSEATFDLHFAHSELLHPKRSSLSILLNDTPVGSLLLTPDNAVDGKAVFHLPARLFEVGDNKLSIVSNIDLPEEYIDEGDCLNDYYREAWLVVYSDSQLNLPGGPGGASLSLANYPPAFVGPADLSKMAFVVPDAATIPIALAVTRIAAGLGRSSEAATLSPQVIDAKSSVAPDQPIPYRILVGRPTQNAAIARVNEALPQPFKPGTDDPTPVEGVAQVLPPSGSVGFIEAALDANQQVFLVVTGNSDEGMLWAAQALNDPLLTSKLKGDLAILDAPDSIVTASVRAGTKPQPAEGAGGGTLQPVSTTPATWIRWASAGVILLTLLILIVLAWSEVQGRSRRESYGSSAQ